MAVETTLKPGWLGRILDEAASSMIAAHDPHWFIRNNLGPVTLPLPKEQADELYRRLDERFFEWTGCHLKEWRK